MKEPRVRKRDILIMNKEVLVAWPRGKKSSQKGVKYRRGLQQWGG